MNSILQRSPLSVLNTDLYQLTMLAGYVLHKKKEQAIFELFVRHAPPHRNYLIACGLETALDYLEQLHFEKEEISYLRQHRQFKGLPVSFFNDLHSFKFTGDVWAVPEGTVVFPGEPLLQVAAPLPEAQIVETYLLSLLNYQTLIASKASRIVQAACGKGIVEFGTRRAHGLEAAFLAARSSYIAGCIGTSNVMAGYLMGIPIYGTVAHSWVMAFDKEEEAFKKYFETFPKQTLLLIDTYNTLDGARKVTVLGPRIKGVRLDSGDMTKLSKQVRKILDSAGLKEVKILASGDLNEYILMDLLKQKAPIDLFGVGTELVTSKDSPSLAGVYKLVELKRGELSHYKLKLSANKATYPAQKQIFRKFKRGKMVSDIVGLAHERLTGDPLLIKIMERGKRIRILPSLTRIQTICRKNLETLPERFKEIRTVQKFPVKLSSKLQELRDKIAHDLRKKEKSAR